MTRSFASQAGLSGKNTATTRSVRVLLAGLILLVFYPEVARLTGFPPRLYFTAVLLGLLVLLIGPRGGILAGEGLGYFLGCIFIALGIASAHFLGGSTAEGSANLQRFLMTFPMAFVVGLAVGGKQALLDAFARIAAISGAVTGALAVVEIVRGSSLFGRAAAFTWLVRGGSPRALLGAEHAIILGVLLASTIPFAFSAFSRSFKLVALLSMLAGIWATGSRGSWGIALAEIAFLTLGPLAKGLTRRSGVIVLLGGIAFVILAYYAAFVWTPVTVSKDWSENSLEYRAAIYSLLPPMLTEAPFGYGLIGMPTGLWLVSAPGRVLDATHSIDSQLVLSALRLGWFGVAAFLGTAVLAVYAMRRRIDFGISALVMFLSGAFLALDAWDGLGVFWMVLLGISARAARHTRDAHPFPATTGSPTTQVGKNINTGRR